MPGSQWMEKAFPHAIKRQRKKTRGEGPHSSGGFLKVWGCIQRAGPYGGSEPSEPSGFWRQTPKLFCLERKQESALLFPRAGKGTVG